MGDTPTATETGLRPSQWSELLAGLASRGQIPIASYRIQLHKNFNFRQAEAILPYLSSLGVSDCYSSPLLMAGPGSTHGYDICDHNRLNPELGSDHDYDNFVHGLRAQNLGHILDFVPNHMGVYSDTNPWWRDVLENGPVSPYARYFDIEWDPIKPELKNKVLLPILGDQYGHVLERGELQLIFENGALSLRYFDKNIPINPRQSPRVLRVGLEALQNELKEDPSLREFLSVVTALDHLPSAKDPSPGHVEERQREKEVARERLERLVRASPRVQQHILEAVRVFNGEPGKPETFDPLHQLLEAQYYRLSYWKTASHEINYRRFFDVNELAGVRMEWRDVFEATHGLVLKLLGEGKIQGIRLDHPDGLYDPECYFDRLQEGFLLAWAEHQWKKSPLSEEEKESIKTWRSSEPIKRKGPVAAAKPLYVVAEKILSTGEALPSQWILDGSSGYDFLNDVNRLFVQPKNALRFKKIYGDFTGKRAPLSVVVYASKRLIMTTTMSSELNVLAHILNRISEENRQSRDFTLDSLRDALREVVACFPFYRTYVAEKEYTAADRQTIERAINRARRRNPAMEPSIFSFVHEVLIPHDRADLPVDQMRRRIDFARKFQQYTGPVQAKGLEDTAFYRHNVLISLNEVGGDPERFGGSIKEFHEANLKRAKDWPHSMLATATHDTKRGEDSRARINVLSEIPDLWEQWLQEWAQINMPAKTNFEGESFPDANDEYLYYQALLGVWPADPRELNRQELSDRMRAYMAKAVKEAKLRTSWVATNDDYEKAVDQFVERTLLGDPSERFLAAFEPWARKLARAGMVNSLAQLTLKLTSPGVPDFYQGTELWDLSLVDPDNRRPVDYKFRGEAFLQLEPYLRGEAAAHETGGLSRLLSSWADGRLKMFVTIAGLRLRKEHPELFLDGEYLPLEVTGLKHENVVAMARQLGSRYVLTIVPRLAGDWVLERERLPVGSEFWGDTRILFPKGWPALELSNIFTHRSFVPEPEGGRPGLSLVEALEGLPVAILEGKPDGSAASLTPSRPWLRVLNRILGRSSNP